MGASLRRVADTRPDLPRRARQSCKLAPPTRDAVETESLLPWPADAA